MKCHSLDVPQKVFDFAPIPRRFGEQNTIGVLLSLGRIPSVGVDQALDFRTDQVGDDGGVEGVQLPASGTELLGVCRVSSVRLLREIGGLAKAVNLIHIQGAPT